MRFEPRFCMFVAADLRYKSVKTQFKTEHFCLFYGRILILVSGQIFIYFYKSYFWRLFFLVVGTNLDESSVHNGGEWRCRWFRMMCGEDRIFVQQKHFIKRIYIARTDTSLAPIESHERQILIGAKLVSVCAI